MALPADSERTRWITPPVRAAYLAAQGIGVAGWWMSLAHPTPRAWFLPAGGLEPAFAAFLVPDLVTIVAGSLGAAVLLLRGSPANRPVCFCLLGAVAYGTLSTLAWTVGVSAPWPGAAWMVVALAGTALVTLR